jgi:orotidine-5'-phosphate decarboxylase
MTRKQLFEEIKKKQSYLCIGLDTDVTKLPKHLLKLENPVLEFNKQIIEATSDLCVAYKPNTAFYELNGAQGWDTLAQTLSHIPNSIFTISDAKRGDIGNTSSMYANAFFKNMDFDSVTVAPYMGVDSVSPFLDYPEKWVILLGLTSNTGSQDFQTKKLANGNYLYQEVIATSMQWATPDQLMFVIGATKAEMFKDIRSMAPDYFFLVPGVGAQGGDLATLSAHGMNDHCGLLVNSSRGILYASSGEDFAERAREEAQKLQKEMAVLLDKYL